MRLQIALALSLALVPLSGEAAVVAVTAGSGTPFETVLDPTATNNISMFTLCGSASATIPANCANQAVVTPAGEVSVKISASQVNGNVAVGGSPSVAASPTILAPAPLKYHLVAAATTNSVSVKGSAGTLYSAELAGIGAAPAYLKFYDKATAPTCNTDTVVKTLIIPAASTAALGAGSNVAIPGGVTFTTGIGICVTTGIADNDNTAVAAATFIVNLDYQ